MTTVHQRRRDDTDAWTVPVLSRTVTVLLIAVSGIFTLLVYAEAVPVPWLVLGPILFFGAVMVWAEFRRRRRSDS